MATYLTTKKYQFCSGVPASVLLICLLAGFGIARPNLYYSSLEKTNKKKEGKGTKKRKEREQEKKKEEKIGT